MSNFFTLLNKELRAIFLSPGTYLLIALFGILCGLSFRFAIGIMEQNPAGGSLVHWTFGSSWFWLLYFPLFPLITMRLFSEEKKQGTLESLITAPVHHGELILAKFFAALLLYIAMWLPAFLNFFVFEQIIPLEQALPKGQIAGTCLILILTGCFHIAIGLFASSLSSNQIISGIICFSLCLLHFLLGLFIIALSRDTPEIFKPFISYITLAEHFRRFTSGLIESRSIIYYLSGTLLFLFLTRQSLELRYLRD